MDAYGFEEFSHENRVRYKKKEKYVDTEEKSMMRRAAKHSKRQQEKRSIDINYRGMSVDEIIAMGDDGEDFSM